jgi:nucleotidyltransferase substrate binding protein (TIGR01987 family)
MQSKLDLSSFKKALDAFGRSIQVSKQYLSDKQTSNDLKEVLQAGVIQHFEFCYEFCWKMLKRQIEREAPTLELIDSLSYPELMREGAERGFIDDVSKWLYYRRQRNITSHTYHQDKATSVYHTALEFYLDAQKLFETIHARNK